MHELTEKEIEKISVDIDQEGLTYTLLKDELLDHICCDIEAEMELGLTFNEAYRKVKCVMGKKRIRQIQDETLYLISKKYRIMKKLMYVLGIAVPILIVIGAIFKVYHWPGAGAIISLALGTTAVLFLPVFVMVRIRDTRRQEDKVPLGLYLTGMIAGMLTIIGALLKIQHLPGGGPCISLGLFGLAAVFLPMFVVIRSREARKNNKPLNLGFYITGAIAGALFIFGALFKIMHWPGAGIVIIVSWLSVAVLFLPLLVLNILKQSENRINNFFTVVLIASCIAIFVAALLRTPARVVVNEYVRSESSIAGTAAYLNDLNDVLLSEAAYHGEGEILKSMQGFSAEADRICQFMQTTKQDMVLMAGKKNQAAIQPDGRIDFEKVIGKDARVPSENVMLGPKGKEGKALKLKRMLDSYANTALSLNSGKNLKNYIDEQFELSTGQYKWAEYHFNGPLIQSAACLSRYQAAVRIVESKVLTELNEGMDKDM